MVAGVMLLEFGARESIITDADLVYEVLDAFKQSYGMSF